MPNKGTTHRGFLNPNRQTNLGRTNPARLGSDHYQYVYVMQCRDCNQNYGANGSDIHDRKCPFCQGGKLGEPLGGDECSWRL